MAKRTAAKRKRPGTKRKVAKRAMAEPLDALFGTVPALDTSLPETGDFALHDLFQQQTMAMLERADLSEEQKQSILVAMNCPCCGGSGLSFTMKLKRKR